MSNSDCCCEIDSDVHSGPIRSRMLSTVLRILAVASTLLAVGSVVARAQEPYLALVGIKVSVEESQMEDFFRIIKEVAIAQHLQIDAANFPKQGRYVGNIRLSVNEHSFFTIGNFRDPNVFEVIAYSHEARDVWQGSWDALVSSLKSRFGSDKVAPWKPH